MLLRYNDFSFLHLLRFQLFLLFDIETDDADLVSQMLLLPATYPRTTFFFILDGMEAN